MRIEVSPETYAEHVEDPGHQRKITEHGSKYNSQRGPYNNSRNIQNPQYEMLKKEFDNKQSELKSLKHAHGKLQKVLTDKGSELSQAVRKAEVNNER